MEAKSKFCQNNYWSQRVPVLYKARVCTQRIRLRLKTVLPPSCKREELPWARETSGYRIETLPWRFTF